MVGRTVWRLRDLMDDHGLKPLDVEREALRLGYPFGKNVIYRLATPHGPARIDRSSLAALVAALRSLTGLDLDVCDLLEYQPDDGR